MQRKYIIVGVLIIAAYGFGRLSSPTRTTETEKKSDTTQSDTERDKHKTTTTTETTAPDGTKTRTTVVTEDTTTSKKVSEIATDDKNKEVVYNTSKVTIYALAGLNKNGPVYGGGVMKEFLGPISLGVAVTTEVSGYATIGLSF